jgi:hypothetical protein
MLLLTLVCFSSLAVQAGDAAGDDAADDGAGDAAAGGVEVRVLGFWGNGA